MMRQNHFIQYKSLHLRTTLILSDNLLLMARQSAVRDEFVTTEHARRLMDEEGI